MKTAIRFRPRLKRPVSTIDRGITRRGNWVLRTMPSCATTERHRAGRRLLEEAEEDDVEQQQDRVVRDGRAEPEDLREDEQQDGEQQQRAQQRPEVSEHGAEVGLLELGDRAISQSSSQKRRLPPPSADGPRTSRSSSARACSRVASARRRGRPRGLVGRARRSRQRSRPAEDDEVERSGCRRSAAQRIRVRCDTPSTCTV